MHHFKVDNLYWGMFIIFMLLLWSLRIMSIVNEESIDVLGERSNSFLNRVKEAMNTPKNN
jgi:hypothetical protein